MVFGGSTDVSLKSSGRRSTAVDEIYTLTVLKSLKTCDLCGKKFPYTARMLAHRGSTVCQRIARDARPETIRICPNAEEMGKKKPTPKVKKIAKSAPAKSKKKPAPKVKTFAKPAPARSKKKGLPKRVGKVNKKIRSIYVPKRDPPACESGKEQSLQRRQRAATTKKPVSYNENYSSSSNKRGIKRGRR
jgi:hypothetical protein